jgi:hypothetical protein
MLRIHDILVWISIRGSMPLTIGSGWGSQSFYFRHWPSRCQQKTNLKKGFLLSTFKGTFTSFFKSKKSKISNKTVGINVFLTIFAWWQKDPNLDPDPDPCLWLIDPDPDLEGPKTDGSGSGFATLLKIMCFCRKHYSMGVHPLLQSKALKAVVLGVHVSGNTVIAAIFCRQLIRGLLGLFTRHSARPLNPFLTGFLLGAGARCIDASFLMIRGAFLAYPISMHVGPSTDCISLRLSPFIMLPLTCLGSHLWFPNPISRFT